MTRASLAGEEEVLGVGPARRVHPDQAALARPLTPRSPRRRSPATRAASAAGSHQRRRCRAGRSRSQHSLSVGVATGLPCSCCRSSGRHRVAAVDDLARPADRWPAPRPSPSRSWSSPAGSGSRRSRSSRTARRRSPGDLRVVVEDDRRAEHDVGAARRPGEHRPAAVLTAASPPPAAASAGGSSSETNPAPSRLEQQVGADRDGRMRVVLVWSRPPAVVVDRDGQPEVAVRSARAAADARPRSAQRRRTSRPASRPSIGQVGSTSSPRRRTTSQSDAVGQLDRHRPVRARCSISTASSQLSQRSPSTAAPAPSTIAAVGRRALRPRGAAAAGSAGAR